MSGSKRLVITRPTLWAATREEVEQVVEAVNEWQRSNYGSALVLPEGWTFEVVEADIPVIVQGQL